MLHVPSHNTFCILEHVLAASMREELPNLFGPLEFFQMDTTELSTVIDILDHDVLIIVDNGCGLFEIIFEGGAHTCFTSRLAPRSLMRLRRDSSKLSDA